MSDRSLQLDALEVPPPCISNRNNVRANQAFGPVTIAGAHNVEDV